MVFKVCCFPGEPDFETLHAAKLTEFPLEQRDYKPFSQGRICFSAKGLHVQFHCFEAESLPSSAIHAYLKWPPLSLRLSVFANGDHEILANGIPIAEGQFLPFTGEDLQGVYWGGTFTIPTMFLQKELLQLPKEGDTFQGNFYKICSAKEKPHYGSYFPANFSLPLDASENLDVFLLISY